RRPAKVFERRARVTPNVTTPTRPAWERLAALNSSRARLAGDTFTIMGVPPVSRQRMGIDRNANGVLDADEALPQLVASLSNASIQISWPMNSVGSVLEFSESLSPPNWKTETSVQSVSADRVTVMIPSSNQNRFYR